MYIDEGTNKLFKNQSNQKIKTINADSLPKFYFVSTLDGDKKINIFIKNM
jgi:hypothetical protein